MDLDAYFERIGYGGPRGPTLDVLHAIHLQHAYAIPFENLAIQCGERVSIDIDAIEHKLVRQRRGGYCFEQNTLLAEALRSIGFQVTQLIARVLWQPLAPGATPPRSHMLLRVELDQPYLADVGFGGLTLTAPLRMDVHEEQTTPHEPHRLTTTSASRTLHACVGGIWRDLYMFTDEAQHAIDFEVANWYSSTHPNARFVQNLMVTRVTPDARRILLNDELTHYHDGQVDRRRLQSTTELREVLAEGFGLEVPSDAPLRLRLAAAR